MDGLLQRWERRGAARSSPSCAWRERSAGEIHRALGDVTFGAVSQHLGVLERAGLVSVRREGRRRLYQARPEGLVPLRRWLESMWDEASAPLKAAGRGRGGAGNGPSRAKAPATPGHDEGRRRR